MPLVNISVVILQNSWWAGGYKCWESLEEGQKTWKVESHWYKPSASMKGLWRGANKQLAAQSPGKNLLRVISEMLTNNVKKIDDSNNALHGFEASAAKFNFVQNDIETLIKSRVPPDVIVSRLKQMHYLLKWFTVGAWWREWTRVEQCRRQRVQAKLLAKRIKLSKKLFTDSVQQFIETQKAKQRSPTTNWYILQKNNPLRVCHKSIAKITLTGKIWCF